MKGLGKKGLKRPKATDIEVIFPGGSMITETDLKGHITFANRKFMEMTGYNLDELIDTPHSILRHPDMPKAAFKELWTTIQKGEEWNGYVKNLRKDGAFYWVHVFIRPKMDEDGNIVGYIAARKVPDTYGLNKAKERYLSLLKVERK
jgi:PAS domain S-box-containing protein